MPCQKFNSIGADAFASAPGSHGGNFSTGTAVVVGPGAMLLLAVVVAAVVDDDDVDVAATVEVVAADDDFALVEPPPPHALATSTRPETSAIARRVMTPS
jgi:hypothetical protein